jgi:hypothetical protein
VVAGWLDQVSSGLGDTARDSAVESGEARSCSGGARATQDGAIGPVVITLVLVRRDREYMVIAAKKKEGLKEGIHGDK